MQGQFVLDVAFSRESEKKVYVQHKMKERAREINELLEQKAYFYVCGDAANMAREVNEILSDIIAEHRGVDKKKAEDIVKSMRASNQYQEDVWS
jgi:NADPH-ferrihemoprotein reductase